MITKHYIVQFFDVGPDPQTGETVSGYKCVDRDLDKVVASGVEKRDAVVPLCHKQLELLTAAIGADWIIVVEKE